MQPAISSSSAIGRPTWLETPTMVALAPRTGRSVQASRVVMPRGVQGRRPNWRRARWPTFSGWKPSTSLRGSMRWISSVASRRSGRGSWTRMPWTSGSALRRSIRASSSASVVVGRQVVVDRADPDLLGGPALVAHVDRGGRVVADQDHGQARARLAGGDPRGDPRLRANRAVRRRSACRRGFGRGASSCASDRPCDGVKAATLLPTRCSLATTRRRQAGTHDRAGPGFREPTDRGRGLPPPRRTPHARTRATCRTST